MNELTDLLDEKIKMTIANWPHTRRLLLRQRQRQILGNHYPLIPNPILKSLIQFLFYFLHYFVPSTFKSQSFNPRARDASATIVRHRNLAAPPPPI